ncbi:hypothetical protein G7Y79_00031g065810 [Physcia stellaris]|nr:hypothetical protein G7Y79_00031g065810 [Physcia stellaris]
MASSQQQQKSFIPLENNPVVFSQLSHDLGVEPSISFHDVHSIDDVDLLAFIPRPVYALLFTCPAAVFERARAAENVAMPQYHGAGPDEPVIWFRQIIPNACGLIALLHGLANGGARRHIQPESYLDRLLQKVTDLQPTERAEVLYNTEELEAAHQAAGRSGDTEAPEHGDHVGNHYICFVKAEDGHLWELNGGMKGPLDRGALAANEDALSEKALQLGVGSLMKYAGEKDVEFSIVAMALAPTDIGQSAT